MPRARVHGQEPRLRARVQHGARTLRPAADEAAAVLVGLWPLLLVTALVCAFLWTAGTAGTP